jgi:hypothetical protein
MARTNASTARDVPEGSFAPYVFAVFMDSMKEMLDLGEFKIKSISKDEFRYFRRVTMDMYYIPLQHVMEKLEGIDVVEKCPCGSNMRDGWGKCDYCRGLGYRDKKSD